MNLEYSADTRWTEHAIQAAFFEWVDLYAKQYPQLRTCFAIPNGANKSRAAAAKFKREGLRSGVPDVCLPVASAEHRGLWIEFKSAGKYPTPEQREWHERLRLYGHRVEVCRTWTDAVNVVIGYLGLREKLI